MNKLCIVPDAKEAEKVYNKLLEENPNKFSNWFLQMNKETDKIKIPFTKIIKVPRNIQTAFFHDNGMEDFKDIKDWLQEIRIFDILDEIDEYKIYNNKNNRFNFNDKIFVKNATFSNKFDADTCIIKSTDFIEVITDKLSELYYAGLMHDVLGENELILREFINCNDREVPKIYNGLPFRTEFRCFYDFDTKEILYIWDYWDYNYCYKHLRDKTDKLIFDGYYNTISENFNKNVEKLREYLKEFISVQDACLKGRWSIDIMLNDDDVFWFIDMSKAETSAYYDKSKVFFYTGHE